MVGPDRQIEDLPASADPQARTLFGKWQSLCARGVPPCRDQLDPFELRPWLGHISVYESVNGASDFRIRLEGTRISQMTGEDWTGRYASEVDTAFGAGLVPLMRTAVRTGQHSFHATGIYQRKFRTAVRMLLPVRSRPDGPVDQIFLVIYLDPGQAP